MSQQRNSLNKINAATRNPAALERALYSEEKGQKLQKKINPLIREEISRIHMHECISSPPLKTAVASSRARALIEKPSAREAYNI